MVKLKTKQAAIKIVSDALYVDTWFETFKLFGGFYMSGPLKGDHFVTGETHNGKKVYALRKMTKSGIERVGSLQDSLPAIKEAFKKVTEGK